MRIAQLAPLIESVPPKGYGGTELVVSLLTEELVKKGHQVTLFASGDSVTSGELVSVTDRALRNAPGVKEYQWSAYDLKNLLKLKEMLSEFDIIHNHIGFSALPFLESFSVPVVSTNHNLIKSYFRDIYFAYRHLPYVAISDAYRHLNYPESINYVRTIYNGIDTKKYFCGEDEKRDYLLFLGRLSSDKGTVEAIKMAQVLGYPMIVAGKVDAADQDYFDEAVKPLLKDKSIDFVGEVGEREKIQLFSKAIACIYPINFDEPFGLVMAEALASGTPVVALKRGSVSEVISDGETGIVANSTEELVERFPTIENLSRADCRNRAERLFSKERMAQNYEQLFELLIEFNKSESEIRNDLIGSVC